MSPKPLLLYRDVVRPEWIDYNDHLNDGYYAVAFGIASERVLEYFGMHIEYLAQTNCTLYTAEMHVNYLRELKVGTPIHCTSQLLGLDAKRIHLFHYMYNSDERHLAATCELMFLHVDQSILKTVPIPEGIQTRLGGLLAEHARLERPRWAGRKISL